MPKSSTVFHDVWVNISNDDDVYYVALLKETKYCVIECQRGGFEVLGIVF